MRCKGLGVLTAFTVTVMLFEGCGGGAGSGATPVAVHANTLAGNWLLAGPLPTVPVPVPLTPSFSLAVTLDVEGNQVTGSVTQSASCGNGTDGGSGGGLSGTVEADGTFTLTSPATPPGLPAQSLTVKGAVPASASSAWSGTYSYSNPGASCGSSEIGPISAVSLPAITGNYVGTGYLKADTSKSSPLTLTATLAQSDATGVAAFGGEPANGAMTASLSITGASCFVSGATNGAVNAVTGNAFFPLLQMNDGSQLTMAGYLTRTDGSLAAVRFLVLKAGTCGDVLEPVTMQRQ